MPKSLGQLKAERPVSHPTVVVVTVVVVIVIAVVVIVRLLPLTFLSLQWVLRGLDADKRPSSRHGRTTCPVSASRKSLSAQSVCRGDLHCGLHCRAVFVQLRLSTRTHWRSVRRQSVGLHYFQRLFLLNQRGRIEIDHLEMMSLFPLFQ